MNNALSPVQRQQLEAEMNPYLNDAIAFINQAPGSRDVHHLPFHVQNISNLLIDFQRVHTRLPPDSARRIMLSLRHTHDALENLQTHMMILEEGAPSPPGKQWQYSSETGKRLLVLDIDLLRTLAAEGMTDQEIAEHLHCSRITVVRRRKELGIRKRQWTELSQDDLVERINQALRLGSGDEGERGISTALEVMGIKVSRQTLRDALPYIDRGSLASTPSPLLRRSYSVPWINALWHIDGHHKLIPWKIVIHGGIDGFSRMVTFMTASNNNRAETMWSCFNGGVQKFGWPSRVRADHGKENWVVKDMMERVRGVDRGSFIMGPSTRNQRIERLWVDLQRWCTNRFRRLFLWMESQQILDADNPLHLWSLHFAYLPMINLYLGLFCQRWNNHGIRTARSNSPRLLWIKNRLEAAKYGFDPLEDPAQVDSLDNDLVRHQSMSFSDYGVDNYTGRATHQPSDSDPYVEVPPVTQSLETRVVAYLETDQFQQQLASVAGPLEPIPDDFGVARYQRVLSTVQQELLRSFPDLFE